MRALVTGFSGFVGRHLVAELARRGYDVCGVDLRTGVDCRDLFRRDDQRFDLVLHCAAHVGGRTDIEGRAAFIGAYNSQLDAAMFEWALRTRPGVVVYFSSSAAYPAEVQSSPGRLHESQIDFTHPLPPETSYGAVKLHGEYLAGLVRHEGVRVRVVRPFSGYGEDQDATYPFRAIVERARRREDPFPVWGPGTQVRDWIHIDDVMAGVLAVAESDTEGPVNFCTGVGTSMLDLAALCCEQAGYAPTFTPRLDRPAGVAYRVGDPTQFCRYWTPVVDLAEGVRRAFSRIG